MIPIAQAFAEGYKHHGPGPHPGTGSPQAVHGGRDVKKMIARIHKRNAKKLERIEKTIERHNRLYGEDTPMVLRVNQPHVTSRPWYGIVIHSDVRRPGKVQATYFDEDGFSSDFGAKDVREVLREVLHSNVKLANPKWFDELALTDRFGEGVRRTMAWARGEWKQKGLVGPLRQQLSVANALAAIRRKEFASISPV